MKKQEISGMKCRKITGAAAWLAALCPVLLSAQPNRLPPEKPNLLFIWTDQQQDSTLAVYGNTQFKVPHLNRLAEESIVFRNSYVVQPVSTPSRGTVLTGMYPHCHGAVRNNVPLAEDALCLPEMLTGRGYAAGYFGKWHLGDEIFPQHGFQEFDSVEDEYIGYYSPGRDKNARSGYHCFLLEKGYSPDDTVNGVFTRKWATNLPYEEGKPRYLSLRAVDFLERHRDEPFILYVNYLEPHSPFNGPFNELHDIDSLPLPDNFDCLLTETDPVRYRARSREKWSRAQWEEQNRNYAGLCHAVDRSVGEILHALDSLGLRENTIVVFTSDHGEMMGAHRLPNKSVMYEQALRVPLMFRIPWLNGGKQRLVLPRVSNIDIIPTLLELLRENPDRFSRLQGQSLIPLMNGEERAEDDGYVFALWNPNDDSKKSTGRVDGMEPEEIARYAESSFRTVISPDGWKLTLSDRDKNQLFNLYTDPGECNNLYDQPGYEKIIRKLSARIRNWQRSTGDLCELKN